MRGAYATDGRLIVRPDERSFAEIDSAERCLRELPVAEKYGMIYVSPTPGEGIDSTPCCRARSAT